VPRVEEGAVKDKARKSLKFNLERNVTCEFLRTQEVINLLPENDRHERRSLLKEELKAKTIIKYKLASFARSAPCKPTACDPLSFIASKIKKPPQQRFKQV